MRDKDTSAFRDMFQYSSLAEKPLTNGRLQHREELVRPAACGPHLDQAKLNDLLPLTIDGVLVVLRIVWKFVENEKLVWSGKDSFCVSDLSVHEAHERGTILADKGSWGALGIAPRLERTYWTPWRSSIGMLSPQLLGFLLRSIAGSEVESCPHRLA